MDNSSEFKELVEKMKTFVPLGNDLDISLLRMDYLRGVIISPDRWKEYIKQKEEKLSDVNIKKQPLNQNKENSFANDYVIFHSTVQNGIYIGHGSNGQEIRANNLNDFHTALAQAVRETALKHNPNAVPQTTFSASQKDFKKRKEHMESFVRNFINQGVAVKGDLPKDKEFWTTLKKEFLSQKGNTVEKWKQLTQFVPQDKKSPKTKIAKQPKKKELPPKAKFIRSLQNGINPKNPPLITKLKPSGKKLTLNSSTGKVQNANDTYSR